jgi:tryptophan synthase beta subunit
MQGNPPEWARYALPDAQGHFGPYGGVFVAETLRAALDELTLAYSQCREDPEFQRELAYELDHFVGRPSDLHCRRLSEKAGGAQIYLKRGPEPHRRPQGEQHRGPVPRGPALGSA